MRHDLQVKFVASQDQLADILTKGLASPRFQWLASKLMWQFPMSLRGVEEQKIVEEEAISGDEEEEPSTALCKVEFNQPSYWLYSAPNLLVFQHLVTMYLGGFVVRVVSEIEC